MCYKVILLPGFQGCRAYTLWSLTIANSQKRFRRIGQSLQFEIHLCLCSCTDCIDDCIGSIRQFKIHVSCLRNTPPPSQVFGFLGSLPTVSTVSLNNNLITSLRPAIQVVQNIDNDTTDFSDSLPIVSQPDDSLPDRKSIPQDARSPCQGHFWSFYHCYRCIS